MKVTVRNDNVDKALSIFKKKCGEVIKEIRDRQYYEKPTTKRNRKRDLEVTVFYHKNDWKLFRFWEHDINVDIEKCIKVIKEELIKKKKILSKEIFL